MLLRVLDAAICIPDGVIVTSKASLRCMTTYSVTGSEEALNYFKSLLLSALRGHGYTVTTSPGHTMLARGEQTISVHHHPEGRLVIRVDDAEAMPHARVSNDELLLDGIRLRLPPNTQWAPGRERHDVARGVWEADWKASGLDPERAADGFVESVLSVGLKTHGVWRPRNNAPPSRWWMVEGFSRSFLVKARLTEAPDGVSISVTVVNRSVARGPRTTD